jgi:hypothetical protein
VPLYFPVDAASRYFERSQREALSWKNLLCCFSSFSLISSLLATTMPLLLLIVFPYFYVVARCCEKASGRFVAKKHVKFYDTKFNLTLQQNPAF